MIAGAHILLYSSKPEADRMFFRDILGFDAVDDGGGWLIFALPPSELAVHPWEDSRPLSHGGLEMAPATLYLMCEDLPAVMKSLKARNVVFSEIETEPYGICTTLELPGGGRIGLYQPTHKTPLGIGSMRNFGALGGSN